MIIEKNYKKIIIIFYNVLKKSLNPFLSKKSLNSFSNSEISLVGISFFH